MVNRSEQPVAGIAGHRTITIERDVFVHDEPIIKAVAAASSSSGGKSHYAAILTLNEFRQLQPSLTDIQEPWLAVLLTDDKASPHSVFLLTLGFRARINHHRVRAYPVDRQKAIALAALWLHLRRYRELAAHSSLWPSGKQEIDEALLQFSAHRDKSATSSPDVATEEGV